MNERLDGSNLRADHLGDLLARQGLEVPQRQDRLIPLRQATKRLMELGELPSLLFDLFRGDRGVGSKSQTAQLGSPAGFVFMVFPPCAQVEPDLVTRYAVEPGEELAAVFVPTQRPQGVEERVGGQLFGQRHVQGAAD